MAVARISSSSGQLSHTLSYADPAGTDRLLSAGMGGESSVAPASGATYGGQTMVAQGNAQNTSSGNRAQMDAFYILETGIAAASNNNIIFTGGTNTSEGICAAFYENVDQTGGATTLTASNTDSGTPTNPLSLDLTEVDGDLIVAHAASTGNDGAAISWSGDMTEQQEELHSGWNSSNGMADSTHWHYKS